MQTGYKISNTKSIWSFHEYTEVTGTMGKDFCPGDLSRPLNSCNLSIKVAALP